MKHPEDLFNLIQTLTPSEKRYFKLFAGQHEKGKKSNSVHLFEAIEKKRVYDEDVIKKNLKGKVFVKQLHVTKNYLYENTMHW